MDAKYFLIYSSANVLIQVNTSTPLSDYYWLAAKRLKTTSASITEWMINLQTF
jgi:hypothetical protein